MPLEPGSQLGPYEVTGTLGAGGMGEVYRARDSRLKRDVALKILPEAFASDPERLARFQREAEVLASLNHPHIAGIYGLEETDGVKALVLELVEGETLADRIARGPITVDEALPLAKQIVEALEAAHEHGVIHRDLKPANIKLRPDGTVKVLDFGLAKALQDPKTSGPQDLANSPTITTPAMTQAGVILGTAAYMSPEQARGRPVDRRADIWAFGCVLYEMLTGKRAFGGEDVTDTLALVVRGEPNWAALPETLSPVIGLYIRRCLQKDPKQRIGDAQDVRLALDGAFETERERTVTASGSEDQAYWRQTWLAAGAAALATLLVAGLVAWATWPRAVAPRISRTTISQPAEEPFSFRNASSSNLAIAPDGARVAYRVSGTRGALVTRPLDSLTASVLLEGPLLYSPTFSPDGAWVAFCDMADSTIKRVAVTGGLPQTISAIPNAISANGITWGDGGTIIFGTRTPSGLWRVGADPNAPEPLTTLNEAQGESNHEWPEMLPGGRAVLFTIRHGGDTVESAQIAVADLETGEQRILLPGGSYARFSASGHLVYAYAGTLRAVPFDLDRLEVTGTPVTVVNDVVTRTVGGSADFAIADDGSLVYLTGGAMGGGFDEASLVMVDLQGRSQVLPGAPRAYVRPRLSPDGSHVAVEVAEGIGDARDTHIWTVNVETGVGRQLTFEGMRNQYPLWSPDGTEVIFVSNRRSGGAWGIYRKAADNSGQARLVVDLERFGLPSDVSQAGTLLFLQASERGDNDIWFVPLDGGSGPSVFLATPAEERAPRFSPDGRWVAYAGAEADAVYVRPYPPAAGGLQRVSEQAGADPMWSPDGSALYFIAPQAGGPLLTTTVETGSGFSHGSLERLFETRAFLTGAVVGNLTSPHDIFPDGQHFVFVQQAQAPDVTTPGDTQLVLVQNFFTELERLVPTRN